MLWFISFFSVTGLDSKVVCIQKGLELCFGKHYETIHPLSWKWSRTLWFKVRMNPESDRILGYKVWMNHQSCRILLFKVCMNSEIQNFVTEGLHELWNSEFCEWGFVLTLKLRILWLKVYFIYLLLFFFLRSPAISLGFTTFGWDFCVCDRFLIQPLR